MMDETTVKKSKTARVQIVVDERRCTGCKICISFCPPQVLALAETLTPMGYHPVMCVDEAGCTGCAICARMCPSVALSVYLVNADPVA